MENYNGIIVVYKEKGCTSFDVIYKLRKILGVKKMGHTGTLDPDAEGVLPVCIGNATKLCGMITDSDKQYVADMIFGIETDTLDMSGTVLKTANTSELTRDSIKEAILSFERRYDQMPPMYSAIKIGGRKLVDLARKGKTVERAPRRVEIKKIEILDIDISDKEPYSATAKIKVECSKGTYIRSLVSDIGQKLGCGAAMSDLVRTKTAGFSYEGALRLSEIEKLASDGSIEEHIIPTDAAFSDLPKAVVLPKVNYLLENGNRLSVDDFENGDALTPDTDRIRVYFSDGGFAAVYKLAQAGGVYKSEKMFVTQGKYLK